MPKTKNIVGLKFGRYLVIDSFPNDHRKVLCKCDCGNERLVYKNNLLSGKTHSCGCLTKEVTKERNFRHGETNTRLYQVWSNMRRRCNDPRNNRYKNYGGRGIKVCDSWNDFTVFKEWADNAGYNPDAKYGKCTLDRINIDGDYEPNNCRWIDIKAQCNNRTSNVNITYNGKTQNITQWEQELEFPRDRLANRLRRGWTVERALSTPLITR